MGVKTIDLVHHIMGRYGKIKETDINDNQNRFDEAFDTNMPIDKYFNKLMNASSMQMMEISHTQGLI